MIKIELDMYQTLAVAVLVLMLGAYLKSKIYFLRKILYSGTCHWRTVIRHLYLYLLYHRSGRIFIR